MKKLAVVGSRNYPYLNHVREFIQSLGQDYEIVSGGAKGVDRTAVAAASEFGMPFKEFFPMWDVFGKSAGFRRNVEIVAYADEVVAFWDQNSKGTKHSIDLAKRLHKRCTIIVPITVEDYRVISGN